MLIFAQNYEKIMDLKDVAVFVVTILIGVVSWASDRKTRKEVRKNPGQESARKAATPVNPLFETFASIIPELKTPPAPPPAKAPVREPEMPEPPQPAAARPVTPPAANPEPQKPAAPCQTEEPGLRPLSRDSLRNAIIWGEILQRKF